MSIPRVIVASLVATGLPFPAGLLRRPRPDSPQLWIMAWAAVGTITNWISFVLRDHHLYNVFLTQYYNPAEGALLLWALSLWISRPVARLTLRLAIPIGIAVWSAAMVLIDKTGGYAGFTLPAYDLAMLCAAVFTLSTRATDDSRPLARDPALWICAGLALYHGVWCVMDVLSVTLFQTEPLLVARAIRARALCNIAAMTLVTVGMLVPPGTAPSALSRARR